MKPKVAFHKQKKELKSLELLLFRSLSGDYHLDGFKQQLDVQAKIPFLDILGIHGYYLLFSDCDKHINGRQSAGDSTEFAVADGKGSSCLAGCTTVACGIVAVANKGVGCTPVLCRLIAISPDFDSSTATDGNGLAFGGNVLRLDVTCTTAPGIRTRYPEDGNTGFDVR